MNADRRDHCAEAVVAVENRSRFSCTTAADASGAAGIRNSFAGWLRRHFMISDQRYHDVVLATYEALANAAQFAYLDTPGPGTIVFTACCDDESDTLVVAITDHGRWRPSTTATEPVRYALRGRGIPLMQLLADTAQIDTSERGTQVVLTWTNLRIPTA